MRGGWIRAASACAVAACATLAATAGGASATTIGQTFSTGLGSCGAPAVWMAADYATPFAGQVRSFAFNARFTSDAAQVPDFLVLRATATPDQYVVVGRTGPILLTADGLQTFEPPSPIAVQAGDMLGLFTDSSLAGCIATAAGDVRSAFVASDPATGATVAVPNHQGSLALSLAANLAMTLDSHVAGAASGPTLLDGQPYTVTVRGAFSPWDAGLMATTPTKGWAMCGTPEDAPLFASPGATGGRVGSDAEFEFAQPLRGKACSAKLAAQLPKAQHYLEFSTDGGATWQQIDPEGSPSAPTAGHVYTYTVMGQGLPLEVRLLDGNVKDNDGLLQIEVSDPPSS